MLSVSYFHLFLKSCAPPPTPKSWDGEEGGGVKNIVCCKKCLLASLAAPSIFPGRPSFQTKDQKLWLSENLRTRAIECMLQLYK